MPEQPDPVAAGFSPGVHQGRQACTALLRQLLTALAPPADAAVPDARSPVRSPTPSLAAAREVWLIDRQFSDWPLDDPLVLSALGTWLRQGGRRLQIVGLDFDATARGLPRFARWRRDWMHAIDVFRPVDGDLPATLWGVLVAPVLLQRLDAPDWRVRVATDPVRALAARTEVADFLQRCEPSWPATTLGL